MPDAHRLTRVPSSAIRRWTSGYWYAARGERRFSPPVVRPQLSPIDGAPVLTFRDLQELRFLDAFRRFGVSWKTIRDTSERAKAVLNSDHPFSTGRFKAFGKAILLEIANNPTNRDGALLDLVRNQLAFKRILAPYLRGLVFEGGEPVRWFPEEAKRLVVLDPARRFGQPIVTKKGVPTKVLAATYRAENSYEKVARWYEVDVRAVKAAVAFEKRLTAA